MGLLNKLFIGVAAGAGTAYFFDPEQGARRREAIRENVAGFLGQDGTNGGAVIAQRVRSMIECPLTPTSRLWSGAAGALAWLVGSRGVGSLLLYRAIANAPAQGEASTTNGPAVRNKRGSSTATRNVESNPSSH